MIKSNKNKPLDTQHDKIEYCFLCGQFDDRGGVILNIGNMRILADLAPILPDHILVSPKFHKLECSKQEEKASNYFLSYQLLSSYFSNGFIVFEHGDPDTKSVSCLTHPHLHVLPILDNCNMGNFILPNLKKEIRGDYIVDNWWPRLNVMKLGKFSGYYHFSINGRNPITIYVQKHQHRQMLRKLFAEKTKAENYSYQENFSIASSRKTTIGVKKFLQTHGLQNRTCGLIFTIEGLAGTGKTTLANLLAKENNGIVINTGRIICSIALHLSEYGLPYNLSEVKAVVWNKNFKMLEEKELSEGIRALAAKLCLNRNIWKFLMQEFWDMAESASIHNSVVVVEGRGFADSAFVDATASINLVTQHDVRKFRRHQREVKFGDLPTSNMLPSRDFLDQNRTFGRQLGLRADQQIIDTTNFSPEETLEQLTAIVERLSKQRSMNFMDAAKHESAL